MLARLDPVRLLFLAIFAALAIPSLLAEGPTFDEPYHLAQGFRYLKTGDAGFLIEDHPPGVQALAAVPMVIAGVPLEPLTLEDPAGHSQRSAQCSAFLAANSARVLRLFVWSKGVVLILGLILGGVIYHLAAQLGGRTAARFALLLFAFDPNFLAHARLVTTDLGAALSQMLVLAALFHWGSVPSVGRAVLLGAALAFALFAKHSAVSMATVLPILGGILRVGRGGGPAWKAMSFQGFAVAATALLMLWAFHGFTVGKIEEIRASGPKMVVEQEMDNSSSRSERNERFGEGLNGRIVPAPEYVAGLRRVLRHVYDRGHPGYLLGENSRQGWWYYFPVAFAIKTPLPTLLLLLSAFVSFAFVRPNRREWVLLAFVAFYSFNAIRGSVNIGYRHLLPILPPLFLLISRLVTNRVVEQLPGAVVRFGRPVLASLALWLAVGTTLAHRHPLAYFNELVGRDRDGWKYLVDASLDWGQDLPSLAAWLEKHHVEVVRLAYYGSVDPALFGIRWLPVDFPTVPPGRKPEKSDIPPGIYAISVSHLVEVMSLGRGPLTVFQQLEPIASVGHSINIYSVGSQTPPD